MPRSVACAVTAAVLAACLGPLLPTCSDEERAAFEAMRHFEDQELVPEDHNTGACAGRFRTTDPDAVIEHYRAELEANGWEIGAVGTQPDGSPIEMSPGYLQAHRGDMAFTVEIVQDGTDDGAVTVLVGEAP